MPDHNVVPSTSVSSGSSSKWEHIMSWEAKLYVISMVSAQANDNGYELVLLYWICTQWACDNQKDAIIDSYACITINF